MTRRSAAIAVVALVLLAGCSGVVPGSGSGPDVTRSDDMEPLAEQSWADGSGVAYDALIRQHTGTVANASSLDYRFWVTDGENEHDIRIAADHEEKLANTSTVATANGTTSVRASYVDNATVYTRTGTPENLTYDKQKRPTLSSQFSRYIDQQTQFAVGATILAQWDFEHTASTDGAYRFEADSISSADGENGVDAANVSDTNATLVVDADGYISELSYSMTQQRDDGPVTIESTIRYDGLGETDVSKPAWTAEAS